MSRLVVFHIIHYTHYVLHLTIKHSTIPYKIYYNILLFIPFLLFKTLNGEHLEKHP